LINTHRFFGIAIYAQRNLWHGWQGFSKTAGASQ